MPLKSSYIEKHCLQCEKKLILVCKRDEQRKKFCGHSCHQKWRYNDKPFAWLGKMQKLASAPQANRKKGHSKQKHPKWIKDRSKIKQNRSRSEERWFFQEVLNERKYTCELTNKVGDSLSVHHIKPVWSNPELRYDKFNVIVITRKIHVNFHNMFGPKCSDLDWHNYVNQKMYLNAA
jgi:hypothetical protein